MSDFTISVAARDSKEEWDQFVHKCSKGTFFHLYDWLLISEQKTGWKLLPLFIKRGNQLAGTAPFFVKSALGLKMAVSPAPKMSTPRTGPIFEFQSDKPHKVEKYTCRVIKSLHEYLTHQVGADYVNVKLTNSLQDVRPFQWLGYQCSPAYTYILNISDTERVFQHFDGRIRTGVRKAKEHSKLTYVHNDSSYLTNIIEAVSNRYEEQNKNYSLDKKVFERVLKSGLKKYISSPVVTDEQGFVTGNIMITFKELASHWAGGVKPARNYPGVNEFLHWNGIKQFSKNGFKEYELMGANTEHLCIHKSRYSGKLISSFNVEWFNYKGAAVKGARKILRR